jgi:hypothetical protein
MPSARLGWLAKKVSGRAGKVYHCARRASVIAA